jgi:hypothetical protein
MAITLDGSLGITTPDLTDTSLTATRVVYAGASGNLTGASNLTFDGTNLTAPRTQFTTTGSPPASGVGLEILGGATPLLFAYNRSTSAYVALNHTASAFGWSISGTNSMTLNTSGGLQLLNTIGVGNANPSTSGAGITFPATQSASSDANTLDDYEEGTFTPTLVGFSTAGTTTYSTQTGLYTKIGRQVTYIVNLVITATTGTGAAVLGGFPFTFNSTVIPVAAMDASALNWTGGTYLIVMPEGDTTTAYIFGEADNVPRTTQELTNETQVIRFTLTHFV